MIVVTTPSGTIGRQVVQLLVDAGHPVRVIARNPDDLPAATRERVEVIEGSHGEAAVVDRAFAGADAVFWLVPPNPRPATLESAYLDFTRPACAAILSCGVRRVVSVSALGRGTPLADHAGLVTASLAMDDLLAATGAHFRALAMPSFMENLLRQLVPIRTQGVFRSPIAGDRRLPTCATRDIAAVASALLADSTWEGQAQLPVLGPEDLSFDDMAEIMSQVLGKPIRYERVTLEAFKSQLTTAGMSDAFVQGYAAMMAAKDNGLDNAEPRSPQAATPTTFRQWCVDTLMPAAHA